MAEKKGAPRRDSRWSWLTGLVDLNAVLSLGDIELRALAEKIARIINTVFPEIGKAKVLQRFWGVLSSRIEKLGAGDSQIREAIFEKLSDLMDHVADHLGEDSHTHLEGDKKSVAAEWRSEFLRDARTRLRKTRDTAAVLASLKDEFRALHELEESMKDPKHAAKLEEGWKKFVHEATQLLQKSADYLKDLPGAESGSLLEAWKLFRRQPKTQGVPAVNTTTTAQPAGPTPNPNAGNQPAPQAPANQNPPNQPPSGGSGGGAGNTSGGFWSVFMSNLGSIWNIGTFWIRIAIVFFFAWPMVIDWIANAVVINGGSQNVTRVFALTPIIVFIGLLLTEWNPILVGGLSAIDRHLTKTLPRMLSFLGLLGVFGFFVAKWPLNMTQFLIFEAGVLVWVVNKIGMRNGFLSLASFCLVAFSLGSAMTNQNTIGTIVAKSATMAQQELNPRGDQVVAGSSAEAPITLPCEKQGKDFTFEELGAADFRNNGYAFFAIEPGCTSPILNVPKDCQGWGRSYTFSMEPSQGSYESRYLDNGGWSGWYTVTRNIPVSVPVTATARQVRNLGDETIIIIPRVKRSFS